MRWHLGLCAWCEQRIWPWQHYAFLTTATGQTRWHVPCREKVDRIVYENQRQYELYQWRLRMDEEDRL